MSETFFGGLAKILINIGLDRFGKWIQEKSQKKKLNIQDIKKRTQILFVDDESFEQRVAVIRDAGWNVKQINDIANFDSDEIRAADIIFMDYKGVGITMAPTEEGIGLLKQLKKRYPEKIIIFYSGYAGVIPGHEVHGIADGWIPKHSDAFVFIDQIEESAKKIYG